MEKNQDQDAVTMLGIDGKPATYTQEQLATMDHATLYTLRARNESNRDVFALLAPFEHRAFAREATAENPALAVPIALATPLYAGAKAVGLMRDGGNATDPSMKQVGYGLAGVGEGLAKRARGLINN